MQGLQDWGSTAGEASAALHARGGAWEPLPADTLPPPCAVPDCALQLVNVTTGDNLVVQELQAANGAAPLALPGAACLLQGRC